MGRATERQRQTQESCILPHAYSTVIERALNRGKVQCVHMQTHTHCTVCCVFEKSICVKRHFVPQQKINVLHKRVWACISIKERVKLNPISSEVHS